MLKMGVLHFAITLLIFVSITPYSSASFCVCKSGLQTAAYQSAIDYACGHGADCSAIGSSGSCYNPNSIQGHCSYACNSYYAKNSPKGATCDFQGAATLTTSDPSSGSCSYSASSGSSGSTSTGTTTPGTTVPTTSPTTPTTTPVTPVSGGGGSTTGGGTTGGGIIPVTPVSGTGTPTPGTSTGAGTSTGTGTPYSSTPNGSNPTSTGVLGGGGMGTGMAPTGSSMDDNHGINLKKNSHLWQVLVLVIALIISGVF